MADTREFARAALGQSDAELEADCEWKPVGPPGPGVRALRLRHRPTGLEVTVSPRQTEPQTRFIALLQLRNRLYDMLRARDRPKG